MIHFLLFIIIAAIVLVIAFYGFKASSMIKRIIISGGVIIASAVALWMQGSFAWHMSFLAILGLSLVTALLYMKVEEREQLEKNRLKAERQALKNQVREEPKRTEAMVTKSQTKEQPKRVQQESAIEKPEKVFGMESIGPVGKGN